MGASRQGSQHGAFSEINVTPFVDVMLVLLIIFMVTAPMMQQGVDVDLPKTTTQNIRLQEPDQLIGCVFIEMAYAIYKFQRRQQARSCSFILNRAIFALEAPNRSIGIETDDKSISHFPGFLQVVYMSRMQDVKTSIGEDDAIAVDAPGADACTQRFRRQNFILSGVHGGWEFRVSSN